MNNRKKRLPDVGLTLMTLVVPLSVTASGGVVQPGAFRLGFCCNTNPGKLGHETVINAFDKAMFSDGLESANKYAAPVSVAPVSFHTLLLMTWSFPIHAFHPVMSENPAKRLTRSFLFKKMDRSTTKPAIAKSRWMADSFGHDS